MADKEMIYTIPLRKEFLKTAKYKRTFRAVKTVRAYLIKHLKSEKVKIGKYLNQKLWERGMKNPPSRVQVKVTQKDDIFNAELLSAPQETVKEEKKKKSLKERLSEKAKPTEEPKTEDKVVAPQEIKADKEELKQEKPKKVTKKKQKS